MRASMPITTAADNTLATPNSRLHRLVRSYVRVPPRVPILFFVYVFFFLPLVFGFVALVDCGVYLIFVNFCRVGPYNKGVNNFHRFRTACACVHAAGSGKLVYSFKEGLNKKKNDTKKSWAIKGLTSGGWEVGRKHQQTTSAAPLPKVDER